MPCKATFSAQLASFTSSFHQGFTFLLLFATLCLFRPHTQEAYEATVCDACDRGFSDTIVLLSIPMLVVASWRLSSSVPPAIRFLFLHFTCFIVENVFSHVPISKHIFIAKSFSLGNLSLLTNFQKLQRFYLNPIY